MKRRKATRIARHDVGALAQQQLRNGKLVVESSNDERGCLVTGTAIDIDTSKQGLLDGGFVSGSDGVKQQIARRGDCRGEPQHQKCQKSTHLYR